MPRGLASLLVLPIAALALWGGWVQAQEELPSLAGTADAITRASGSLPFFYDLYTFRGKDGRTEVVAAFAVPVDRLRAESMGPDVRYRFDVTLVLADTALHTVSRTDDSVFVQVPGALDGDHLLHTHVAVEAPPSESIFQRVLMFDATTPGVGQLYGAPLRIPDYTGTGLMLSDIALGLPGADAGWDRGDVTLALLPTSQFPQSSFDVFYEIYNLPAGHPYTTDLSVERIGEDGEVDPDDVAVSTRFADRSTAGPDDAVPELRRVEASLDEGRYRLSVTVTDETTGRTAEKTQLFEVRGWGPGIMMVPALPSGRENPSAP